MSKKEERASLVESNIMQEREEKEEGQQPQSQKELQPDQEQPQRRPTTDHQNEIDTEVVEQVSGDERDEEDRSDRGFETEDYTNDHLNSSTGGRSLVASSNESRDDVRTSEVTSSCCHGCLTSCLRGRPREQRRLLTLNLVTLLWSLLTAGLSLWEIYKQSHGQCIVGMPMYEGGLDPRNVKMFYCKCPLYTLLLTGCVCWLSLMVNWVSDLHSKRPDFYKWLRWQAGLTAGATAGALGSALLTLLGFGSWCGRVHDQLLDSEQGQLVHDVTVAPIPARYRCFDNARRFDDVHKGDNQLVLLQTTFIFTMIISIMITLHLFLWLATLYYTVRMLKVEPKNNYDPAAAYQQALAIPRPIYPDTSGPDLVQHDEDQGQPPDQTGEVSSTDEGFTGESTTADHRQ